MGAPSAGYGTLAMLVILIASSVWLGTVAQRAVERGSFLKGYFLGNRGLGPWALALTATVQSGGTFMGFPSLAYSYGWIVALWIAGYMVVPMTGFGVLGKRIAQISRRTGAITVPDLFRERFGSSTVGLVSSLLTMFFMAFMMVAQFKAGALIMKIAWPGTGALALSEDQSPFVLNAKALESLRAARVPDEVVAKLKPLEGEGFGSADALTKKLGEVLTPSEISNLKSQVVSATKQLDRLYYLGLVIFTLTVVGYTLIGGFLAAVWTDLFQSVMMFFGVVMLLLLAIPAAGGMEHATREAVKHTGPGYAFGPGYAAPQQVGTKTTGPSGIAPTAKDPTRQRVLDEEQRRNTARKERQAVEPEMQTREFLPLGLAFSFFFVWVWAGVGNPAGMVRIMASKDTATMRRSVFLLNTYNVFIYLPLVMICVCARALFPTLPPGSGSDEIIPLLSLKVTEPIPGGSLLAGLILTAPYGAVMATVSGYLVVIASGLVRDVYQRFLRPDATQTELRRMSYLVMIAVGLIAFVANLRPVTFLQAIVVFSGTSAAATFAIPALMTCYWRRATAAGALAAMLAGAGTSLTLYATGWIMQTDPMIAEKTNFAPYYLAQMHPIVWGLAASLIAGVGVSLFTTPPEPSRVSFLFDAQPEPAPAGAA
jgi:SSS family solute:Na+ symporter/sodium/pantothenate symporter